MELTSSKVSEKHFTPEHILVNSNSNESQLTENAMPDLLLNSKMVADTEKHFQSVNEGTLSESSNSEIDNIELQDTRTCAYVTALKNFMTYNINCLYCDATFPIKKWNHFIEHVQDEHKLSEDEDLDNSTKNIPTNTKVPVETVTTNLPDSIPRCPQADYASEAEDSMSCIKSELEFLSCSGTNDTSSAKNVEQFSNESRNFKSNVQQSKKLNKTKASTGLKKEISVETTDETIVFGFIDAMRSNFRLWYTPKTKQASQEKQFVDVYEKFKRKHQFKIKREAMFESVQKMRDWYQEMFKNEKFLTLKYPQSEYYRKLAAFLPDNLDGKSCEICNEVLPDNLQHYAHKQQEHKEIMATQQDPENFRISGVPKTKIDEYLRARYPITESLNFECQVCFQKIPARWKLIHHIKAHIDIREYVCDICGAAFVRKSRLALHRKRHLGENIITCKICGKKFNDFSPLTNHRLKYHRPLEGTIEEIENVRTTIKRGRNASGVFKYQIDPETKRKFVSCPWCGKRYAFQSGLSKHLNRFHKELWLPKKKFT